VLRGAQIRQLRNALRGVPSSRLALPFRPASTGPLRYWQDRSRLALKGAVAAVTAWALARYAAHQLDPYFAPLAALLGVYPTVARSLRESVQYIGGFLLGAALAVPVGILAGPGIPGIAAIVLAGVLLSGWHRLGDQGAQVTFTALFVLLLGGYQPLHYVTHRMIEVAIGVVTGLAVNVAAFPPLQLRPAEHAVRRWAEDIAEALELLADAATDPRRARKLWPRHDRQLTMSAEQTRAAVRNARDSLRWNPRARSHQSVPRPDSAVTGSLERLTAQTRAIALSLLGVMQDEPPRIPRSFGQVYARMLRMIADAVRQLGDQRHPTPSDADLDRASACQHHLEHEAAELEGNRESRSTAQLLSHLAGDMIRETGTRQS
jgi:uncharacterized membrane protein YccC